MSQDLKFPKISRNILKSTLEFLRENLLLCDWTNTVVIQANKRTSKTATPNVAVTIAKQIHKSVECGSQSTTRDVLVILDIRANNENEKLDLSDTVFGFMKKGWPYREYELGSSGEVINSYSKGNIQVIDKEDIPIELDTDKSKLLLSDRYRHRLTFSVSLNVIET